MLKKILLIVVIFQFSSCTELQQVINQLPNGGITNDQIAGGLKEALNRGITNQVTKLAVDDGFYKNELTRILLPEELQKVDKTLRAIGLSKLADEGLKVLNRAAEDAVGEAIPVFVDAIKEMTFTDAKNILLGEKNAATQYLQTATSEALYQKFNPIITNSFQKVGADKIWTNLITKYNNLPLTNNVNPDLTDYVTVEALKGVFAMVEVEEKEIREKVSSRTSDLLKKVFALQDK
ncbi:MULTISPECIES: DUF4197 domain-containing protein [Flavobacteriaceae]|uniref:DUF4197 domain-containing protein n=2 Tax=Flavobacteriaceae TaxID=49546 RepID=A0A4Y8ATU1_9FLAO|nr:MULTISPECIES: DUF4197 domain-containing protein [Flavobacteriaceae]TEW75305.1 DUF4197 domain-containing protein [Gramella jeungdoensis]GGK44176.1 hypothetical protein GCM10007963_10380 [Lutibacter litoralis]